ncbi:hypothetical protein [Pedobacter africanus]|uniref:Uncharacterized protein n=1 Tax=Pedobacter africanus TaxID=151894 RepID=A0A1W1Z738_9SPHI|nr:hypothetical protein [Pedobacter africanus]SMC43941.1 hypothetical protein SAMN04488524_0414 [Pedobacter africanus]
MEQEPDFKLLYEMAQLEIQNLKDQLERWETRGVLLRQLAQQQEILATQVELTVDTLKAGAIGIGKMSIA